MFAHSQGLRYVDEYPTLNEGDNPETFKYLKGLRIQFHLNLALVQLKANLPADAIKSSSRALDIEEITQQDKAKAYYRRGQAYGKLRDDELAIEDLKRALENNPNDAAITHELNATRLRQKTRREKEKKAFSKMFS
jgi:peptidyl-prolyl isomerase D